MGQRLPDNAFPRFNPWPSMGENAAQAAPAVDPGPAWSGSAGVYQAPSSLASAQQAIEQEAAAPTAGQVAPAPTSAQMPVAAPQVGGSTPISEIIAKLNKRELASLEEQGLSVSKLKGKLAELEGRDMPLDLSGLAALTDAWSGSHFAQSYQPAETLKDRRAAIDKMQGQIMQAEQGMSENEIAMLRSQLNNEFQVDNLGYRKEQDKAKNELERQRIAKGANPTADGKILPAHVSEKYTESQGTVDMATDLSGVIAANAKFMGPVSGGLLAKNPYDVERRELQGKFDLIRQKIGRMIEGGVLRKEDEIKYQKILPSINDMPEVAASKAREMEAMLKQDIGRSMENYGRAGYNVSGFADQTKAYQTDAAKLKEENLTPQQKAAAELAKRRSKK